ncbi:restriction endonuclease subunit S [Brevibacillus brevis]|uniref:restriction endonuclease subunit S n=1 Tax=Brevibacillus brevis TaxID=1393 RepID=UPI0037C6A87D
MEKAVKEGRKVVSSAVEAHEVTNNNKQKYVPEGWKVCKINELLVKVNKPVKVNNSETYREIGIRSHGKGIFYKESILGESLGDKSVFWVEPECFIVNIVFAWEMAVAKTTNNELGFIASHRFPMYRPVEGKLNIDFITYLFKSSRGKHLLNLASPGGAGRNKTLGQKEFADLEVTVPSNVDEQRVIAEILSTWDKAIDLKEKLIEQKKEQKKGLIQKLLTGKVRLSGFDQEWKKFNITEIADKTIVDSFTDGDWIESPHITDNGVLFIQTGNIGIGEFIEKDKKKYISEDSFIELKCTEVKPNDILICRLADPIGRSCLVPNTGYKMVTSVDVTILRVDSLKASAKFINYLLNLPSNLRKMDSLGAGSTRKRISRKNLGGVTLEIPPLDEQNKIVEVLSCLDKEILLLKQEFNEINKQKKGLMQILLSGKVRVKV